MTITTIITLNLALSTLTALALLAIVRLAHRLPGTAPDDDARRGDGGDPRMPSGPPPLVGLTARELVLAHAA